MAGDVQQVVPRSVNVNDACHAVIFAAVQPLLFVLLSRGQIAPLWARVIRDGFQRTALYQPLTRIGDGLFRPSCGFSKPANGWPRDTLVIHAAAINPVDG